MKIMKIKILMLKIMISVPINKSYENIFSDDLDGWDDEIEEFK